VIRDGFNNDLITGEGLKLKLCHTGLSMVERMNKSVLAKVEQIDRTEFDQREIAVGLSRGQSSRVSDQTRLNDDAKLAEERVVEDGALKG